jgi:hypothetical protein
MSFLFKAFKWHLSRPYMARNVEHHLTRLKWETVVILGLILSKKQENKSALFRVI